MPPGNELPVCLLTGGGGLLGSAIISANRSRMNFLCVYRSKPPAVESNLQKIVYPKNNKINEGDVYCVEGDLLVAGEIERVVDMALARYDKIDYLINAAADQSFYGSLLEYEKFSDQFDKQMQLNCAVPAHLASVVARKFWKHHAAENRKLGRAVVHISSTAGVMIFPHNGRMYSASKAALNYLTCHMGNDFDAIGVRVNALAPTSFPSVVSMESVLSGLTTVLGTHETGKVFALDELGFRKIN